MNTIIHSISELVLGTIIGFSYAKVWQSYLSIRRQCNDCPKKTWGGRALLFGCTCAMIFMLGPEVLGFIAAVAEVINKSLAWM